jgi:hypothetical protein
LIISLLFFNLLFSNLLFSNFSQLKKNEKDFSKFNALPKRTQEKLLGKFLAGNTEARLAFEKNEVNFGQLPNFVFVIAYATLLNNLWAKIFE